MKSSKERLEQVTLELNDVSKELADAHGESLESDRQRKRNELVDNLKRIFPDRVYGRLVDVCQPSHKRFQLAVTKVLGKHMMSIICDTEQTARDCITYMKEQRAEIETFLPISYLDVHPINEKLRELSEPRGVKLVFDVIQCNLPAVRKALQFACGNALVCETAEDARQLAFGGADRHKAVSLDGTLFQQSGVISGGASELRAKASKWDEKKMRVLKERKNALMEEAQQLHKTRKKELDVEMKRNQLQALEKRLKYTNMDRDKVEKETMARLEQELEVLKSEYETIQPKIDEIEERMNSRLSKISALEKKKNEATDHIFADFCRKVGISDIRYVFAHAPLIILLLFTEFTNSAKCAFTKRRRIS